MINYGFFKARENEDFVVSKKDSFNFVNSYIKGELNFERQKKIFLLTIPVSGVAASVALALSLKSPVISFVAVLTITGVTALRMVGFKDEYKAANDKIRELKLLRETLVNYLRQSSNSEDLLVRKKKIDTKFEVDLG